jgi:hypothetical protein
MVSRRSAFYSNYMPPLITPVVHRYHHPAYAAGGGSHWYKETRDDNIVTEFMLCVP